MEKHGIKTRIAFAGGEHQFLPGNESIQVYAVPGMGLKMMQLLYREVRQKGIQVIYSTN